MKVLNNKNGFTLIEMIIVIAILAVIAGIAIPSLLGSINSSKKATDVASAKIIADSAGRVLALEGKYSGFTNTGINLDTLTSVFTAGGDLADDFQSELFSHLNQKIPDPKYSGTDIDEVNFILTVTDGRIISVYIGDGTDITSGNALQLYPEVAVEYLNNRN